MVCKIFFIVQCNRLWHDFSSWKDSYKWWQCRPAIKKLRPADFKMAANKRGKKANNTRSSQAVSHPSTILAQCCFFLKILFIRVRNVKHDIYNYNYILIQCTRFYFYKSLIRLCSSCFRTSMLPRYTIIRLFFSSPLHRHLDLVDNLKYNRS